MIFNKVLNLVYAIIGTLVVFAISYFLGMHPNFLLPTIGILLFSNVVLKNKFVALLTTVLLVYLCIAKPLCDFLIS